MLFLDRFQSLAVLKYLLIISFLKGNVFFGSLQVQLKWSLHNKSGTACGSFFHKSLDFYSAFFLINQLNQFNMSVFLLTLLRYFALDNDVNIINQDKLEEPG